MDDALRVQLERRQEIISQIQQILVLDLQVRLPIDAIEPDAPLFGTGLGLDSVDAVELVVASEHRFKIRIPEETLKDGLRTINTLVDLVLDHMPAGPK